MPSPNGAASASAAALAPIDAAADANRRNALVATCVVGGIGAAAMAVPFVESFLPSERAKAAGAPVQVDISDIAPGERKSVEWRGKPIWLTSAEFNVLEVLLRNAGRVVTKKEIYAQALGRQRCSPD